MTTRARLLVFVLVAVLIPLAGAGALYAQSPPTLISPANGSTAISEWPIFTWSSVGSGQTYNIEVDDSPDFSSPVMTGTSFAPSYDSMQSSPFLSPFPAGGATFWWHVRVSGGSWSETWSFKSPLVTIAFESPTLWAVLNPGTINVKVNTRTTAGTMAKAEFYFNGALVATDRNPVYDSEGRARFSYKWNATKWANQGVRIEVKAFDTMGNFAWSQRNDVVINP